PNLLPHSDDMPVPAMLMRDQRIALISEHHNAVADDEINHDMCGAAAMMFLAHVVHGALLPDAVAELMTIHVNMRAAFVADLYTKLEVCDASETLEAASFDWDKVGRLVQWQIDAWNVDPLAWQTATGSPDEKYAAVWKQIEHSERLDAVDSWLFSCLPFALKRQTKSVDALPYVTCIAGLEPVAISSFG
ncbi:unnamed protein product, partial [Cladocopium goreaui]